MDWNQSTYSDVAGRWSPWTQPGHAPLKPGRCWGTVSFFSFHFLADRSINFRNALPLRPKTDEWKWMFCLWHFTCRHVTNHKVNVAIFFLKSYPNEIACTINWICKIEDWVHILSMLAPYYPFPPYFHPFSYMAYPLLLFSEFTRSHTEYYQLKLNSNT